MAGMGEEPWWPCHTRHLGHQMETTLSGWTECHVRHWLSSEWKVLWEHRAGHWEAAPAPGGETRKRCVLRPGGQPGAAAALRGGDNTAGAEKQLEREPRTGSKSGLSFPPAPPGSYLPISL